LYSSHLLFSIEMVSNFPADGRHSCQIQRQAMWPTKIPELNGDNHSNLCPVRYVSLRQQHRRWTRAFDTEAQASRMSFIVGDTLLPRVELETEHRRWAGMTANRREIWFSQLCGIEGINEKVWSGEFDVERRASWKSRNLNGSSVWSDGHTLKKLEGRDGHRGPLSEDQIAQIDGYLISREILEYHFEGTGTQYDPHLVTWIENDSSNPLNFSVDRKWANSLLLAFACFMVSVASSGLSQGMSHIAMAYYYRPNAVLIRCRYRRP
jgi:hypothetical protein